MKSDFKKLCKIYNISVFILFGSEATGRVNRLSDLDLAYLPQKELSPKQEADLYLKVIKLYKRDDIDLVDISKAGIVLKYSIIKSGKVLVCENQKAFYNFVVKTRSEYLDTQYIRQVFFDYMNKRIQAGKFGG